MVQPTLQYAHWHQRMERGFWHFSESILEKLTANTLKVSYREYGRQLLWCNISGPSSKRELKRAICLKIGLCHDTLSRETHWCSFPICGRHNMQPQPQSIKGQKQNSADHNCRIDDKGPLSSAEKLPGWTPQSYLSTSGVWNEMTIALSVKWEIMARTKLMVTTTLQNGATCASLKSFSSSLQTEGCH